MMIVEEEQPVHQIVDFKMNKIIIPVLASILVLGTMWFSYDAFAGNHGNNGNNGCEKAGNAKACENNPNTVTCFDCGVALAAGYEACGVDAACNAIVIEAYFECAAKVLETTGEVCGAPPAPPRD